MVRNAGFIYMVAGEMVDVFSGSPHESDAKDFETRGLAFTAQKPE